MLVEVVCLLILFELLTSSTIFSYKVALGLTSIAIAGCRAEVASSGFVTSVASKLET